MNLELGNTADQTTARVPSRQPHGVLASSQATAE